MRVVGGGRSGSHSASRDVEDAVLGGHRGRRAARGRPRRGPPGDSPRVRATPRREGRSDARRARAAGHGTSPVHGEVGPVLPRPTTYRLWLHRREPPPSADPHRTARGPGVPQPVSHTATSSPVTPLGTPPVGLEHRTGQGHFSPGSCLPGEPTARQAAHKGQRGTHLPQQLGACRPPRPARRRHDGWPWHLLL